MTRYLSLILILFFIAVHSTDSISREIYYCNQERLPTRSPGLIDMSGVKFHQIRYAVASDSTDTKSVVEILLHNSKGTWYVGGLEWFLWIGNTRAMRGCGMNSNDSSLKTACFRFSKEQWKRFKQGDPVVLTWGDSEEVRNETIPFAKLDKKMLKR